MKRILWVVILVAITAGALGTYYYYSSHKTPAVHARKLFLIGIDGASWNLMSLPLKEGKLPNIQKLIETGTSASLKTLIPTASPVLWTSIATGKMQSKHGIGDYTSEKDGETVPVSGGQRSTKAYWNIVSDYGLRVGVVNWWVTWPAEKVNGFMVSDRYRQKRFTNINDLTYPADLIHQLPNLTMTEEEFAAERRKYGLPENLHPVSSSKVIEELVGHYKGFWVQDKQVLEASNLLLAQNKVDVFGVVFRIVDVSSHLFWTYIDIEQFRRLRAELSAGGSPSQEEIAQLDAEFAKQMEPVYAYADQMVGELQKYADANTSIILCSDHGFKLDGGSYGHSKMKFPPDGVLILNGPYFRKNTKLQRASILDITPTLLYLEGIPVGRDMDGKPLLGAFTGAFLKSGPPLVVSSHDKGFRQKGEPASSEMDKEILEDFKSLGYIK